MARLLHISLTARDAKALSVFYQEVFGLTERRACRTLSGPDVSRGNGLPNCEIISYWLDFPAGGGPFLEILQYNKTAEGAWPAVNAPGFGHIALQVKDMEETLLHLRQAGGAMQGKVSRLGSTTRTYRIVYVRDPEGNILEIEELDRS